MSMNFPPPPPPENPDRFGQPDPGGLSGLGEDWERSLPWNAPEFEQRQPEPPRRKATKPSHKPRRSRPSLPWKPVLAVVAIVALIGGAFFAAQAVIGDSPTNPDPTGSPAYPPLSRPAPPGWTKDVVWSTEAALQSNVAVGHGHVAYLTSSGLLVVHNATTGETIYSSTPTGLASDAEVGIAAAPDPVVIAWDDSTLIAWNLGAKVGDPVKNDLPAGSVVSDNGGGVVAAAPGNQAWALRADLKLHKVNLPKAHAPLAMTGDGKVIAAPSTGRWSTVNETGKATEVRHAMADKATGNAMYPAWSAGGVVVAWAPTKDDSTRAVAFYDALSGKTLAQTTLSTAAVNLGLPLSVTPDGALAAAGPLLVNLKTGTIKVMDDWVTTIGTHGTLYGRNGGEDRYMWTGEAKAPTRLDPDTAIPWGVHDNYAIVTDKGDSRGLLISAILREGVEPPEVTQDASGE